MLLVGEQEHTKRPAARADRRQQQVAVAEGLGQQLTRLQVMGAVRDDHRLLGGEDAAEQGGLVRVKAQLVQAHLIEEPALPQAPGRGRGDQRL